MKVLVHLNHGSDKSYMLNFGAEVSRSTIQIVLRLDGEDAAQVIYNYANLLDRVQKTEIPADKKTKAACEADFVVGHQGYISERLA